MPISAHADDRDAMRIQPWTENAHYWQHRGRSILLVGASNEDNLFNHPTVPPSSADAEADGFEPAAAYEPEPLAAHLDRIVAVGGNYVRNTMSSRDEGNVWPFHEREEDGLYDLERGGAEYWQRFRRFLDLTVERGIIVQIEVWDRFDYAREPWQNNPFNPKNNVNYTSAESGLPERVDTHPGQRENPFFRAIPELDHNELILRYQRAHVERLLDISLEYDHVLYCISNETNDTEQWSRYWARFLRERAEARGMNIEVTEMWDKWDLRDAMHARTFDHPELYSFVDVSQNSHQQGQTQWDRLQWVRQRVAQPARPVNSVKMYGGNHGGGPNEGQHKLWRNVLGGAASARYHRPGGGMGLNRTTEAHLRSLALVRERVNVFALEPANELLGERAEDEAYLAVERGVAYVVYFPRQGRVVLDLAAERQALRMQWISVPEHRWQEEARNVDADADAVTLDTPGDGPWVVVLTRR
ncbi:MAG: hypothetical protein WD009_06560 [Phycisphaeraceae bacterium]